ncbi:MAG TPA: dihydroorotase, partial [Acidobacteriota bacterium]|nr:dihydroorotase [Acidobacteriota bacterium]HNC45183.1 dihydroorotase [Acidobacteriota bacterium]
MSTLFIRNGHLIDPAQNLDAPGHLLIQDGRIAAIGPDLTAPPEAEIFEASGLVVAPGFIDIHVHLREPGQTHKETIATGTRAAAAGGFTAVCCMPNTSPVNDSPMITRFILDRVRESGLTRVYPIGAITKGSAGETLAEIGGMREAGIVAISDDGHPVRNAQVMRRAMEYACDFGLPVIDHCENKDLSAGGVMNEGIYSTLLGLRGMTRAAEEVDVARDIVLAELTGAHVHIAHLSTAGSVNLVRWAKSNGVRISCEVTPHHFTLTDAATDGFNTNAKMNPPLRTERDVEALLEGIADGTVDVIATDHAPHCGEEKSQDFDSAPFGILGLESAVSLAIERLYNAKHISLNRLVDLFSTAPARLLNLPGGSLRAGQPADVTMLDLTRSVQFQVGQWQSKSHNSPFDGWQLTGAPVATFIGGKQIFGDGKILVEGGNL